MTGILRSIAGIGILLICTFLTIAECRADVIINILAVNAQDKPASKNVEYSLPGEIKPEDILDTAGLTVDYNVKDAGYYLHGNISLNAKETKTFKVRLKDVWRLTDEQVAEIRAEIERGYREMGGERDPENALMLKQALAGKLDYILNVEQQVTGGIDARVAAYRNHLQTIKSLKSRAQLIDYWRMDAKAQDPERVLNYVVEVSNPTDKPKKVKQQHYLPKEVKPEYIVDLKGFELRYDEKKHSPFLFKEEDLSPGEKRKVVVGIQDVWRVPGNELKYVRAHVKYLKDNLAKSPYFDTAMSLHNDVVNNLDLIDALQAQAQPDIQQHIGAYRINEGRFEQAKKDMDALEKLLARYRSDLEKSKIKNVMQKIQSLKSLSRVSEAIFDKKPTINAAWKLIGAVMLFLAIITLFHFVTWFVRSAKEKKQEEVKYAQKKEEPHA